MRVCRYVPVVCPKIEPQRGAVSYLPPQPPVPPQGLAVVAGGLMVSYELAHR